MTKAFSARFTIPFVREPHFEWRPLVFRKWLPLLEHAVIAHEGDLDLGLSIDANCAKSVGGEPLCMEEVGKYRQIEIERMNVEVSGVEVSDELAGAIVTLSAEKNFTPEHIDAMYDAQVIQEYCVIGRRVYDAAVKHFNRLIAYFRAVKGQFWLREFTPDGGDLHSDFNVLRAKAKVGDSSWVRLTATGIGVWTLRGVPAERSIVQDDWQGLRSHLLGQRNAPLVGQLLAASDEFRDLGHTRAALTEAVSALEIAISQFSQRANPEAWSTLLAGRSGSRDFKSHVQHLGTTCTIGYLFPVIFSEVQLPGETLQACQEAIVERNAVIHSGKREILDENLDSYLRAIRSLCEKLRLFGTGID